MARGRRPAALGGDLNLALDAVLVFLVVMVAVYLLALKYGFSVQKRNMLTMYAMLAASIAVAPFVGIPFPVVYIALFVLIEVLFFSHVANITDSSERVASAYQWFDVYLPDYGEWAKTADLTEGYFGGDWTLSAEEAMKNKYDKIYELLGLEEGMTVLDVGSGYCQWLEYLKGRGVHGVGFTLSREQVIACAARGLYGARVQDARDIPSSYDGAFDSVTMIGSTEHMSNCFMTRDQQTVVFRGLFARFHELLKPSSRCRSVFVSGMKSNDEYPETLWYRFNCYLLERHYNGRYTGPNQLELAASPHFKKTFSLDTTEDYRYISIVEPNHFGNFEVSFDSWKKVWYLIFMFMTDPYALHKWLYHACGTWMWQFGGDDPLPRPERTDTPFRASFEVFRAV